MSEGTPDPRPTKNCDACGEEILAQALKCRFCGVVLDKEGFKELKDEEDPPPALYARDVSGLGVLLFWLGAACAMCILTARRPDYLWGLVWIVVTLLGLAKVITDARGDWRKKRLLSTSVIAASLLSVVVLGFSYFMAAGFNEDFGRRGGLGNESAAIGALKTIGTAQSLFREADKELDGNLDYGSLNELANSGTTGLIDKVLGSGTKNGYLFQVSYGATTSEFIWFATAEPAIPGVTGDRYFCANHEGVTFYTTTQAFRMNTVDCTVSAHAVPVGR